MIYKGIVKERARWLTILFVILAALMLWRTIVTAKWAYIPIVILVILACFFTKEQIISEEGVDIKYTLFGRFSMHNLWPWEDVTAMHTDYEKSAPNVQLLIAKDVVIRPFEMTRSDARAAIAMGRRINPAIDTNELTEEEQEKRDAKILHDQEVRKAQANKAKNKKKHK